MKHLLVIVGLFLAITANACYFLWEDSTGKLRGVSDINLWDVKPGYTVVFIDDVHGSTHTFQAHSLDGREISAYSLEDGRIMVTKTVQILSIGSVKSEMPK